MKNAQFGLKVLSQNLMYMMSVTFIDILSHKNLI